MPRLYRRRRGFYTISGGFDLCPRRILEIADAVLTGWIFFNTLSLAVCILSLAITLISFTLSALAFTNCFSSCFLSFSVSAPLVVSASLTTGDLLPATHCLF